MLKRLLCVILALSLIPLSGCMQNVPKDAVAPSDNAEQPSTERPANEEKQPPEGISTEDWYRVPEYTDSPLIEPDPERQVYISLPEQDCDFYTDAPYGVTVYVITKEHMNANDISVRVPMETSYNAKFTEFSKYRNLSDDGGDFMLYHYMSLKGVDWHEFGQMYSDASEASARYMEERITDYDAWQEIYSYYCEPYNELYDGYEAEYEAISTDEIPVAYLYYSSISFSDHHDETVETIEIDIGDETYTIDIGQWRFHSQPPEELSASTKGVRKINLGLMALVDNAYRDGYARLWNALEFNTTADITLTGIEAKDSDVELLGGRVQYTDSSDNSGMDFYWDGKQPLDIPSGTHVVITPYAYDERFKSYEHISTMLLLMDYEVEGVAQTMAVPCMLQRFNDVWDTYLLAFERYDIGEYYICYGNLADNWVREMPESWKR